MAGVPSVLGRNVWGNAAEFAKVDTEGLELSGELVEALTCKADVARTVSHWLLCTSRANIGHSAGILRGEVEEAQPHAQQQFFGFENKIPAKLNELNEVNGSMNRVVRQAADCVSPGASSVPGAVSIIDSEVQVALDLLGSGTSRVRPLQQLGLFWRLARCRSISGEVDLSAAVS